MAVWDKLTKARTAQQFESEVERQRAAIAEKQARLVALENGAGEGPFADPNFDSAAAGSAIAVLKSEIEMDERVLASTMRRLTEARKAEGAAALEARAAGARKLQAQLRDAFMRFHDAAENLAAAAAQVQTLTNELREHNSAMIAAGRGDLEIANPDTLLRQSMTRQPFNIPAETNVPEYWPRRHPDGPYLAGMKTLKF